MKTPYEQLTKKEKSIVDYLRQCGETGTTNEEAGAEFSVLPDSVRSQLGNLVKKEWAIILEEKRQSGKKKLQVYRIAELVEQAASTSIPEEVVIQDSFEEEVDTCAIKVLPQEAMQDVFNHIDGVRAVAYMHGDGQVELSVVLDPEQGQVTVALLKTMGIQLPDYLADEAPVRVSGEDVWVLMKGVIQGEVVEPVDLAVEMNVQDEWEEVVAHGEQPANHVRFPTHDVVATDLETLETGIITVVKEVTPEPEPIPEPVPEPIPEPIPEPVSEVEIEEPVLEQVDPVVEKAAPPEKLEASDVELILDAVDDQIVKVTRVTYPDKKDGTFSYTLSNGWCISAKHSEGCVVDHLIKITTPDEVLGKGDNEAWDGVWEHLHSDPVLDNLEAQIDRMYKDGKLSIDIPANKH